MSASNIKIRNKAGFSIYELIIIIAMIAIIAVFAYRGMMPAKRIGDTRDAVRKADTLAIQRAVEKYALDNYGLPSSLSSLTAGTPYMIVKKGGSTAGTSVCTSTEPIAKADILTDLVSYLPDTVKDPTVAASANDTGYYVLKRGNNYLVSNCYSYR